ncbi:hypothetical protein [Agrobacterium cavarae]|uniref:hypothetical protein n=1 Tax=Agrobacterium TaxID=357 RepID=UPI0007134810|nr:hypothetical protein [Agrobacterium cavarae]KQR32391.1 hypothetical protein ASF91_12660 [Rhizobium sp. Leaf155]KQZ97443.1 hypothetical protein ASD74_09695 [Rhizobium sp. Root564]
MRQDLIGYCLESGFVDWTLLTSCSAYRKMLSESFCRAEERQERAHRLTAIHDFESLYWDAIDMARSMGSDGHFLKEPHIGVLPSSGQQRYYLIWSDDDHGSIFVISPVEMPWLGKPQKR